MISPGGRVDQTFKKKTISSKKILFTSRFSWFTHYTLLPSDYYVFQALLTETIGISGKMLYLLNNSVTDGVIRR